MDAMFPEIPENVIVYYPKLPGGCFFYGQVKIVSNSYENVDLDRASE